MGTISLSIFTSSSRPPIYISTHNENHSVSYVGILASLEDIRHLLEQRSEVEVPLVNYATVEMHQSDRVLRQFGFRQPIPVTPEVFDNEHNVDLRGEATTNSCPKGMMRPFKSKKKGRRCRPINSSHTIIRPNSSADDTHITAFSDYAKCVS
ncbi:hypothetical protein CXB51_029934 [Gossypium anomalum]|uniref:Uncharacterized protein n=1 Tax=Gossypium anomalum TaxID=47600 RepID=A0A8J6CNU8_9ROSI|nr:hypothetical protein CXB51_029934 [Gossypium anomalum]